MKRLFVTLALALVLGGAVPAQAGAKDLPRPHPFPPGYDPSLKVSLVYPLP